MNLYRFFEAKEQNKRTAGLIRALAKDGRASTLPSGNWIGDHYRKMDPITGDKDYQAKNFYDKPVMRLLTCSNSLEIQRAYNGDVRVIGPAIRCKNHQYCACCGTLEARRVSSQLRFLFYQNRNDDLSYYMLTLTLPNRFDGFKDEFIIYNKCLNELLQFCGWRRNGGFSPCVGAFAAKELTYSYDKGFHPHIHIILAYKKDNISSQKLTRKGFVKSLGFSSGRFIDALSIRDKFVELISRKFPEYYSINADKLISSNIGFEPISNIDSACEEICKYLCDFNSFTNKNPKMNDYKKNLDAFYIFLRDSWGVKKYSKLGAFSWSPAMESLWKQWIQDGKPTESNAHFIQFVRSIHPDWVYFGRRYGVSPTGELVQVPMFYSPAELEYGGDSLYLSYNSSSSRYDGQVFDKKTRKLLSFSYDINIADVLINQPREDVSYIYQLLLCKLRQ